MCRDVTARRAEVDQHWIARLADDDVVRCDIAMQEIGIVDGLQGVEQRRDNCVQFFLPRRPIETLQPCLEALTFFEVQHHVGGIVRPERPVDADNVAVIEFGQRLSFFDEAFKAPSVVA